MRKTLNCVVIVLVFSWLWSCVPPEEIVLTEVNLSLQDSTFQKIVAHQDRQLTDSLLAFFDDKDPSYRYAAAMAFASTQDATALDSLLALLRDPVVKVREAAAYAIGQIGEERAAVPLMNAFEQYDSARTYAPSNRAILEATGKIAPRSGLDLLSSISTYQISDTLLLEGQTLGIYRFALRGITSTEGTSKMLTFVNNQLYPPSVRLWAAHYLARARDIQFDDNLPALGETLASEADPFIRMALVRAIGKNDNAVSTDILIRHFEKESDYRIKVNTLGALAGGNYDSLSTTILAALDDSNIKVAETAARFLITNGTPAAAAGYYRLSKEDRPWPIKVALLEAASTHLPPYMIETRKGVNYYLQQNFLNAQSTEEKAAYLTALGSHPDNYRFLLYQVPQLTTPLEKTAVTGAIGQLLKRPDFGPNLGIYTRAFRDLNGFLLNVFRSGDVGAMAVASGTIHGISDNFKSVLLHSIPIIQSAQQELPLPQAIETYNAVQNAIAYLEDKTKSGGKRPAYNHPIDMSILRRVSPTAGAVMQTDKGKIRMEFLPTLAPGTVVNFIRLVEAGFFKDKTFHRVVPNFVIQGGCPRGDGYGSLDYTIRSELPMAYYDDEGYVGMASAGNHTEGTQFFITHSPTPHLDGKYTIFAKVSDGMQAVHQMQAGDNIQSVAIRY